MKYKGRKMLVAFVAVLALGVVASASASAALPEFVPAKGETFPIKLEASVTPGSAIEFSTPGLHLIECKGVSVTAEVTAAKTVALSDKFTGCGEHFEGCYSSGQAANTIVLSGTATLAYLEKSTKKVGLALPMPKAGVLILCKNDPRETEVFGGLIGSVTPVNSSTKKLELSYQGTSHQEWRYYENEKGEKINDNLSFSLEGGSFLEGAINVGQAIPLSGTKSVTLSA